MTQIMDMISPNHTCSEIKCQVIIIGLNIINTNLPAIERVWRQRKCWPTRWESEGGKRKSHNSTAE
jgi:hypothetical protein